MRQQLQHDTKSSAIACGDNRCEFRRHSVNRTSRPAENIVDGLLGDTFLVLVEWMAQHLLRKHHRRRRLALGARIVDDFPDRLGGGTDQPADQTGEQPLGYRPR